MKNFITTRSLIAISAILLSRTPLTSLLHAQNSTQASSDENLVVKHKTIKIDGLEIFYREAGPKDAPTLLLLHGFPTSSHMFRNSEDSEWRNRDRFLQGRDQIREFLAGKWERELDYRLVKSLWNFCDNRIAVRFQYEYQDAQGQWYRAYGNELWEFDDVGLMMRREASINDIVITEADRRFHWVAPGQSVCSKQ